MKDFDKFAHLNNDAVQNKSEDYGKFESANKMSFAEFEKYIEQAYPSSDPTSAQRVASLQAAMAMRFWLVIVYWHLFDVSRVLHVSAAQLTRKEAKTGDHASNLQAVPGRDSLLHVADVAMPESGSRHVIGTIDPRGHFGHSTALLTGSAKNAISNDIIEVKSDGSVQRQPEAADNGEADQGSTPDTIAPDQAQRTAAAGEGSELPVACIKFFEKECQMAPPDSSSEAVQAEFTSCCIKGGHEESTCESLLVETFSNHPQQEPVDDFQCKELVDLYKAHVQWAKDHVSSPESAEALLNSRASGDRAARVDTVDTSTGWKSGTSNVVPRPRPRPFPPSGAPRLTTLIAFLRPESSVSTSYSTFSFSTSLRKPSLWMAD